MTLTGQIRTTVVVTIFATGVVSGAVAQVDGSSDPQHANLRLAQAAADQDARPAPSSQSAQSGTMRPGMMGQGMSGQGMMGQGMMGDMMRSGMMAGMPMTGGRGHMLKVMFAIADADGDGALSFEEVTAIHKRIFTRVDVNKDGKVTIEEVQAFMRE